MKKLLLPIITLALAVSCQEAELTPVINMEDDCLYGTMESMDTTKTSMDENNNILWSEGDQLVAFMKTTLGRKYQIKEEYVGSTTGGFSRVTEESSGDDLESGNELNHNVVLYPYASTSCMKNDDNETANSYKVNLNLPETQTYAVGSFGKGSFPMIAVSSSNELLFKNICGGIKLQFKGIDKIKSIKLESIGGEKISGKATVIGSVDGTAPVITMTNNDKSYTHVTLDCGEGVQLSETTPTTFIIALPPVEFASGMKITVTDTDGLSRTLTNSSSNTIKRSSLLTFPVITYQQEGVFEIPEGTLTSHEIPVEGGIVEIPLTTNQEYEVVIPEDAKDWISVVETKALREETVILSIAENTAPTERSAEVIIATTEGITLQAITIGQKGKNIPNNQIKYTATAKIVPYRASAFGVSIVSNEWNSTTEEGVITFSGDVTSIGTDAFYSCSDLTSVTIPNSVTNIGSWAFSSCGMLTDITIPDNVKTIGERAFSGSGLETVTIGTGVTSIGKYAFAFCDNLTEITIPESVNTITSWAFVSCDNLKKFSGKYSADNGRCLVKDAVLIAYAEGSGTTYIIPDSVTKIGEAAFCACDLTAITMHDGITTIASSAFRECTKLVNIDIPNSVTQIGKHAFYSCTNLSNITIGNKVSSIEDDAFSRFTSKPYNVYIKDLTAWCNISFGASANPLDSDNSKLYLNDILVTNLTIPSSINKIKNGAFSGYSSLKSVTIPDSVTEIGEYAFSGCDNLSDVTFGNKLITIGFAAFHSCQSLENIDIPNSVTTIGGVAFCNCYKLKKVISRAITPPSLEGTSVFYNNSSDRKIYVPSQSVNIYKETDSWINYADSIFAVTTDD